MSTHKHINKICCVVLAVTLIITILFMNAEAFGVQKVSATMEYETKLFDTSTVHTIDIIMEDWETFTANCKNEEYYVCTVVIDDETYKNVAIRGKGNTSLTQVETYGNDRYSFKIEFDHYDTGNTYYGLDKLCLNNIIQDNTYMKDYLTYQMMAEMGVASPLCSYVYITVNGEDWGLYLAVEGVEESFLQRNYGNNYGELYKPDSLNMGGGRGNGGNFNMEEFLDQLEEREHEDGTTPTLPGFSEDGIGQTSPDVSQDGTGQTSPDVSNGEITGEQLNNGQMQIPNQQGNNGQMQTPEQQANSGQMQIPGQQGNNGQMQIPEQQTNSGQMQIPNQQGNNGQMQTPEQQANGGSDFSGGELPNGELPNGELPGGNFSGSELPSGELPGGNFSGGNFSGGELPNGELPGGNFSGGDKPENMSGGFGNSTDDVLLKYTDDNFESYSNIFDNAKTKISDSDKKRLIASLKDLSNNENLTETVNIEEVIRYFVVHNFVLNFDSYTGSMIHNYYLYEEDGQLEMIPWDYNLAFGGFEASSNATTLVNYPIDSPISGGNAEDRPMIAWIFENEEYTNLYHQYFSEFISLYFENGYFEEMIDRVSAMIAPYVEKDPTKFCTYEEFTLGISTLKEFCLLRAESIAGQLEGTIGSTTDTQETATLIDAGNLQISDMGSMNMSMGGGMDKPNENVGNMSKPDSFS